MTSATLRRAGLCLYGEAWTGTMADALDVAPRTVQRWASGKLPIPASIWPEILEILTARDVESAAVKSGIMAENPGNLETGIMAENPGKIRP